MKKSARKSASKTPPVGARRPTARVERRLILVAEGPIRADWLARLEQMRADEARWEKRLRDFEREGRPAFEAWLQKHFASLRADLLRLAEEVRGLEMVANEIAAVSERLRVSEGRAYAIVKGLIPDPTGFLGRLRSGELNDEDEGAAEDLDAENAQAERELPPDMREFAREMFIDFLRAQGFSRKEAERAWREEEAEADAARARAARAQGAQGAPRKAAAATPPEAPDPTEGRARELFRQIARRLHPDAGAGAMDERKLALWHAAQEAWERRDVGALEAVLWETEPDAAARGQAPVGAIARVVQAVRERIKDLSRQWEAIRQTPAGKLVTLDLRGRERLRRQFENELRRDRLDLGYAKEELLAREGFWDSEWQQEAAREARQARRGAPKARKKARPAANQFDLPF